MGRSLGHKSSKQEVCNFTVGQCGPEARENRVEVCNQHGGRCSTPVVMLLFRYAAVNLAEDQFAFFLCFKTLLGMREEGKT